MKFENIKYSKCPNCKKHGISFYKTGHKYNPIICCKFCGKKFRVNRALSMTVIVLLAVLGGVAFREIKEIYPSIPTWTCYALYSFLWLAFEYFAPLEEYEEK